MASSSSSLMHTVPRRGDNEIWWHGGQRTPSALPITTDRPKPTTADSRDHSDITSSSTMPTVDQYAENMDVAAMDRDELQDAVVQAYMRLARKDMILLLSLRTLPTFGENKELAFRLAVHDLSHRTDLNAPRVHTPPPLSNDVAFGSLADPVPLSIQPSEHLADASPSDEDPSPPSHHLPALPYELWADIFEWVNDWELAAAIGVKTSLRPLQEWAAHASALDRAILSGSVSYVSSFLKRRPASKLTRQGAKSMVRFNYTSLLSLLHERRPEELRAVYSELPILASRFGQTAVLQWWLEHQDPSLPHPMPLEYTEEALDEASRKGHIHVLQWWKDSGLEPRYGLVMDVASSSGQLPVLEWWKNSGLQLEYGRHALRSASYRGEVEVLEWWKRSGLRLIYDKEVLVEATKFNRVEVLEWWKNSGLRVEYLLIDIEAALEDAIGGGKEAREWWRRRGVRFDVTVREWMEYKVL